MKGSFLIIVLISAVLLIRSVYSLNSNQNEEKGSDERDPKILGAAIEGLSKWDGEWAKRNFLVVSDMPVTPAFPCSKAKIAADIASQEALSKGELTPGNYKPCTPWDTPNLRESLDVDQGPIIGIDLLLSIINRSNKLAVLPRPISTEHLVMGKGKAIDRMFRNNDTESWLQFRKKYPGAYGLVECSAPGYDSAGSSSIVYLSLNCGSLNGVGVFFFLSKRSEKWVVTWSQSLWIS